MKQNAKIAVVIPCFRVSKHILSTIGELPEIVDYIFVVDDACPEQTGTLVQQNARDPRIRVLTHQTNRGVGGAMRTGYGAALQSDADIVVKIDGDGQMNPRSIDRLIEPILSGKVDFVKGNRFFDFKALRRMPLARRIGNMGLTLLAKFACGYWEISDPTNGFVAIHRKALELLDTRRWDDGYFFECQQLAQLNIIRATVAELPMPAKYDGETSSLSVRKTLFTFPYKLMGAFAQRVIWRYYVYSMNAVTIFLTVGALLSVWSLAFGSYRWYLGAFGHQTQTAGTVALGLFPAIMGFQMLLQAMILDILDKPSQSIQTQWANAYGNDTTRS